MSPIAYIHVYILDCHVFIYLSSTFLYSYICNQLSALMYILSTVLFSYLQYFPAVLYSYICPQLSFIHLYFFNCSSDMYMFSTVSIPVCVIQYPVFIYMSLWQPRNPWVDKYKNVPSWVVHRQQFVINEFWVRVNKLFSPCNIGDPDVGDKWQPLWACPLPSHLLAEQHRGLACCHWCSLLAQARWWQAGTVRQCC